MQERCTGAAVDFRAQHREDDVPIGNVKAFSSPDPLSRMSVPDSVSNSAQKRF
jgi:hypothetical protein